MEIYCFQYDTAWESGAESFQRIDSLMAGAPIHSGDLLIFPELSTVGFSMDVDAVAEPKNGPSFCYFSDMAKKHQCHVIAGISGRDDETGLGLNEAVCFQPDGSEVGRYQKVHPFTLSNEGDFYRAGDKAVVFEINGWKVAPAICYDLRFPELFRSAMRQGAELFAVIANWPDLREDHWLTLLQARAIENQAYVAGVNRCGNDPALSYSGASLIVDPKGQTLSRAGSEPEVISARLDRETIDSWRRDFPALSDAKLA